MLKNILNLNGALELSKNEQKTINGGVTYPCRVNSDCTGTPPAGTRYVCYKGQCKLELLAV